MKEIECVIPRIDCKV